MPGERSSAAPPPVARIATDTSAAAAARRIRPGRSSVGRTTCTAAATKAGDRPGPEDVRGHRLCRQQQPEWPSARRDDAERQGCRECPEPRGGQPVDEPEWPADTHAERHRGRGAGWVLGTAPGPHRDRAGGEAARSSIPPPAAPRSMTRATRRHRSAPWPAATECRGRPPARSHATAITNATATPATRPSSAAPTVPTELPDERRERRGSRRAAGRASAATAGPPHRPQGLARSRAALASAVISVGPPPPPCAAGTPRGSLAIPAG